jgi:cell wall-associated NlpC family hydrolase
LKDSQPGDLFYFGDGEKVKHVGICVGGKAFIHQGGKVDIHSLDPQSEIYNQYRANTFMFVRRIGT